MFGPHPPGISGNRLPRRGSAPRPWRQIRFAALVAIGALLFGIMSAATASASAPGAPSGWSTVFSDDFTGSAGSGVDGQWMYDTGAGSTFGTGEIETMTNSASNVHLDGNGNLDLTALDNGGSWTSGRVQTTSANVGAPAGGKLEVTASIEQPTGGLGYWPAFWMLGPGQWPENGEIDIMEDVNALSEVSGTVHCGTDPGGPCNETTGIGSGLRGCAGCQSGFHTYTMILDRTNTSDESITFYLDGASYFTVTEAQIGTSTWQAAFDHNLSIILDLAMGGSYPDSACGCTAPDGSTASGGTMQVDYVQAYTTSGGGGTTGSTYSALPGTWASCAAEGGTCGVSGSSVVAFGASGRFNYADESSATSCSDSVFGDPDSGVVKSCYDQGAPPGTNTWAACSGENGTCSFTGVMTVAYGADGGYAYATLGGGTACNNSVFGDPSSGNVKACYVMGAPPSFTTWTDCSAENGSCSFSGTHEVAFGANGQYFYGSFNGGTGCSDAVFGDPDNGVVKACYVQ
jgi:hypothetical protein